MINPCSEITLGTPVETNITVPEYLIHIHFHQEFRYSLDRDLEQDLAFIRYLYDNNLKLYSDFDTCIVEVRLEELITEIAIKFG